MSSRTSITSCRIRSSSCFICLSDTGIRVRIDASLRKIVCLRRFRFENNGQMQPTLWRHRRLQSEIRALRVRPTGSNGAFQLSLHADP